MTDDTRRPIFDAIKAARGGKAYTAADVALIDALLDRLNVPLVGAGAVAGTVSQAGVDLIKSFEGCRLTAYPDPGSGGDPWTIGWGSTGPDIGRGTVWTQEKADRRFAEHVAMFARGVLEAIGGAGVAQHELDAMTSLAYNIGLGNFLSSTLLKKHKAGDKGGAAAEFGRWNKADGKVMAGLTRRRKAEADMYLGGGA